MRLLVVFLSAAALLAAGCGGGTVASADLTTISSVDQFARAFDADAGHPRLILLLSPT